MAGTIRLFSIALCSTPRALIQALSPLWGFLLMPSSPYPCFVPGVVYHYPALHRTVCPAPPSPNVIHSSPRAIQAGIDHQICFVFVTFNSTGHATTQWGPWSRGGFNADCKMEHLAGRETCTGPPRADSGVWLIQGPA